MKVKISRRRKSPDTGTKYQAGTPETQALGRLRAKYTHRTDLTVYALCISRLRRALSLMKLPLAVPKEILRKALRG